jgi:hypothetical protein
MKEELKILSDYTINDEEFESKYPHKIDDEYILRFLEDIYLRKDGVLMEHMTRIAFNISLNDKLVPIFCKLIKETWHNSHEDLALFFEFSVKNPDCIDDVIAAMHIKCNYWHDDGDAFIRKCAYVLGNLETPYAIQKLEELTNDDNEIIRKYASLQLNKIEERKNTKK